MKFTASIALLCLLTGCVQSSATGVQAPPTKEPLERSSAVVAAQAGFETARSLWQSRNLHTYSYSIVRQCYCTTDYTRPMRVDIRNGKVVAAIYTDDRSRVGATVVHHLRSIDAWFDRIEQGYEKTYYRMEVRYHPSLGYPQTLLLDKRERVADDEERVTISHVTAGNG